MLTLSDIDYKQVVDSGQTGTVYKCQNSGMVVKVTNLSIGDREYNILSKLRHPGIIHIDQRIVTRNKHYSFMKYYDKSLKSILPTITHDQIKKILTGLLQAVVYCHSQNIVHRDIKVENVMLVDDKPILIDFDLAHNTMHIPKIINGTPYYISPEVYKGRITDATKGDIWALGVLTYYLMTKTYPFDVEDDCVDASQELMIKILTEEPDYRQFDKKCELTNLVKMMLCKNPDTRPSAKVLLSMIDV